MSERILRAFGLFFLIDGLFTSLFGHRYVSLFRFGSRSNYYRKAIEWLIRRPPWQLRSAGVTEATLGVALLSRTPLELKSLYRWIAIFYDPISPIWRVWLYPAAHDALDKAISKYLPEDGDVLDLGCGTGANLNTLVRKDIPFGSYTGVDLSEAMLAQARKKFGDLTNVSIQQIDLMNDPLPDGRYDLILSTWVFEQIPAPMPVIGNAWDHLREGGHILLLFGVIANSIQSRIWDSFITIARGRLISEDVIHQFPGLVYLERYSGGFGDLALVNLEKNLSE